MSGQIFEQHVDERGNVSVRISNECVVLTHEEAERIKAKFDQIEAENAKLRRELADTGACQADTDGLDSGHVQNLSAYEAGYRDGSVHYELDHCPACKNIADLQEALEENAKLIVKLNAEHIVRQNVEAENRQLRKENDTLCHRIDELCREVESLRRTAKRIVKFNHDTDYATGHTECSECHGTINPYALFCEHCGALFKEGE